MEAVKTCASRFTIEEQLVQITLEGSSRVFYLQKGVLCNASDYFTRALEGQFKEGVEQTLRLPGCDEATFEVFIYWLCNRKIPETGFSTMKGGFDSEAFQTAATEAQQMLVRLWCFADSVLMPGLQDEAMLELLECFKRSYVKARAVETAFALSATDSPLQKAMMDELTHQILRTSPCFLEPLPGFEKEEIDSMAAVPGLMGEFLKRMLPIDDKWYPAATHRKRATYLVSGGESAVNKC